MHTVVPSDFVTVSLPYNCNYIYCCAHFMTCFMLYVSLYKNKTKLQQVASILRKLEVVKTGQHDN